MGIFNRDTVSRLEHERAIRDIDDEFGEERANYMQRIGEMESQMKAMQRAVTDEGLNSISSDIAAQIDNIFVRAWDTPAKRTRSVQLVVREAIREAMTGSAHWNPPSV